MAVAEEMRYPGQQAIRQQKQQQYRQKEEYRYHRAPFHSQKEEGAERKRECPDISGCLSAAGGDLEEDKH